MESCSVVNGNSYRVISTYQNSRVGEISRMLHADGLRCQRCRFSLVCESFLDLPGEGEGVGKWCPFLQSWLNYIHGNSQVLCVALALQILGFMSAVWMR